MTALASDWLLFWYHWTECAETWQDARTHHPLPSLCFGADRKNKVAKPASDCLDIFDFFSETTEGNLPELNRKQELSFLYQVCVFRTDQKNRMTARNMIFWHFIYFFSDTAEPN